jgi:hypothetical protein
MSKIYQNIYETTLWKIYKYVLNKYSKDILLHIYGYRLER